MKPEFSRRMARVINSDYFRFELTTEEKDAFKDRVAKNDFFKDLSKEDQKLVKMIEDDM